MTIEQAYGSIDSKIQAKGPTAAKACATALLDAFISAGVEDTRYSHPSMTDWKVRVAASDGSVAKLGVIVRLVLQAAAAGGMLLSDVADAYAAAW